MQASNYHNFKEHLKQIYSLATPVWKVFLTMLKIWSKGIQISIDERRAKPADEHMKILFKITEYVMGPYSWSEIESMLPRDEVLIVAIFDHSFDLIVGALNSGATKVL